MHSTIKGKISKDKSNAYRYTIKGHTIAIFIDGNAVLDLGDIGPEAFPL